MVKVTVQYPSSQLPVNPPGVVRVKRWGQDPTVSALTHWDYEHESGNFQHMSLATPAGGFAAVSQWQRLTPAAEAHLASIQIEDEYTVKQKMGWLIQETVTTTPAQPYWRDSFVKFGTCVFGGQLAMVEVDGNGAKREYVFDAKWPTRTTREPVTFYKLVGMGSADFGKFTHVSHPWYIQKCTAVGVGDAYLTQPKGTVFHAVLSPKEFLSNNGDSLYLAKVFCE